MSKRPHSITIISWIFIIFCSIALLTGLRPLVEAAAAQRIAEFKAHDLFEYALIFVFRGLAVLCGVLMLYGFNWARWLLIVWIGYHVIIGFMHSPFSSLVHSLLFALFVYFLFRPAATAYFRGGKSKATTDSGDRCTPSP